MYFKSHQILLPMGIKMKSVCILEYSLEREVKKSNQILPYRRISNTHKWACKTLVFLSDHFHPPEEQKLLFLLGLWLTKLYMYLVKIAVQQWFLFDAIRFQKSF